MANIHRGIKNSHYECKYCIACLFMYSGYPVTAILSNLADSLRKNHTVLVAPPGAGKSTIVPLYLKESGIFSGKKIIMLEPRKLAVLNCAGRMSSLISEPVGKRVGYRFRNESCVSKNTEIEVLTEGILVRQLITRKELPDVGCVILDEFHERNIETDLAFAMLREAAILDSSLRILVMSATVNVKELVQNASIQDWNFLESGGKSFPVHIEYLNHAKSDPRNFFHNGRLTDDFYRTCRNLVQKALSETNGHILVFLPGAFDIAKMRQYLETALEEALVLPLHSGVSRAEQMLVFQEPADKRRKVILSTNIAETSLTIDGVTAVIDSGVAKFSRYDPTTAMESLVLDHIAMDSAQQRTGRAGRTAPGICYRMWLKESEKGMARVSRPALLSCDLSGPVLMLYAWGTKPSQALLPSALEPASLIPAEKLLVEMGALQEKKGQYTLTPKGEQMSGYPINPRLASALVDKPCRLACEIFAFLEDRPSLLPNKADLGYYLHQNSLGEIKLGENAKFTAEHLFNLIRRKDGHFTIAEILAEGYPDRLARQRKDDSHRYVLANGRGAKLKKDDSLCAHAWLVAAFCEGNEQEANIRLAVPIEETMVLEMFAHRIENIHEMVIEKESLRIVVRKMLGAIEIQRKFGEISKDDSLSVKKFWTEFLSLSKDFQFTEKAEMFRNKIRLLREIAYPQAENYPPYELANAIHSALEWVGESLSQVKTVSLLRNIISQAYIDMASAYSYEINNLLPNDLILENGLKIGVDYSGEIPFISARIQRLFGVKKTPILVQGKIPLQIHLLSPAGRPVQITSDLAGFWVHTYPQVRKELRGRYPRHKWPEDALPHG